jgi:adenine phosphoribosyltransferase
MFNDITELLLRPGVFKDAVDMFVERYRGMGIAAVAGKIKSETGHRANQSSIIIIGSS